jgi:murein DD-endopeptidase MepM/ murein hydrolase activator NlpD
MSRLFARASVVVALLSTAACTQPAAMVDLKGQNSFTRNGEQFSAYMPSAGGNYNAPSKYTTPISMGTAQVVSTDSVSVSDLSAPVPTPVAATKPEPVKIVPHTEQKTAEVQTVNPWTKKPRTEFLEAKNDKPVAALDQAMSSKPVPAAKTKAVTLSSDNAAHSSFIWPVNGSKIISAYGPKGGGKANDGINIAAASGEPVWAAADGETVYVGNELEGYGNMVIIKHANNKTTTYSHLSQITVDKYDRVHQGDIIGYVGTSGNVKKPQLHFAIRDGKDFVDPMKYISRSVASN